jgi:class 3 adenylate cyclase
MDTGLWSRTSEVRYARVDDAHVAYRVVAGDGSETGDVVWLMAGTLSMEALFEDPVGERLLDGLAGIGRLVVFDRRGIGLSDPPVDWQAPVSSRWSDDVEAVIEAARLSRPTLVCSARSWKAAVVYCDRHPRDVAAIAMFEPFPVRTDQDFVRAQIAGELDSLALFCPSRVDEPGFREWWRRAGRVGASPTVAARAYGEEDDGEIREIEQAALRITVPTLVLRRPAHALSPDPSSDPIMSLVPGALRVDLPGEDLVIYGGEADALLAEVSNFVTGEYRLPAPERVLAAVFFSDLVASTERATALGDAHWKRLLDHHDEVARSCIGRRGGAIIKIDGDGILALFPSATNAVRAAQELRAALLQHELQLRVGIHVGEVDRRGDDVSGIAVVVAARVMAQARQGEVLVSEAVPPVVAGSDIEFQERGEQQLKGVPGAWSLYAIPTGD